MCDTRIAMVNMIKKIGHTMSFEEKRSCEWDLYLVHGILEFGYTYEQLNRAKVIMQEQGLEP